ncbi:hypothetical protein HOK51_01285 [Candidatus Woesearchaeota archaeon]|jgi:hypothetical protein|nr:hypothetical protein [Candidatus Woesearchaeota archaeon]MBT6518447.1 hypothetical protein [Candidatus Woesearchaeota archaeon]
MGFKEFKEMYKDLMPASAIITGLVCVGSIVVGIGMYRQINEEPPVHEAVEVEHQSTKKEDLEKKLNDNKSDNKTKKSEKKVPETKKQPEQKEQKEQKNQGRRGHVRPHPNPATEREEFKAWEKTQREKEIYTASESITIEATMRDVQSETIFYVNNQDVKRKMQALPIKYLTVQTIYGSYVLIKEQVGNVQKGNAKITYQEFKDHKISTDNLVKELKGIEKESAIKGEIKATGIVKSIDYNL